MSAARSIPFWMLLFLHLTALLPAQAIDAAAFRELAAAQRFRYVHDYPFEKLDSSGIVVALAVMLPIAEEKHDLRSLFALKYQRFYHRALLGLSDADIARSLDELAELARRGHLNVEAVVARHYSISDWVHSQAPERAYLKTLRTFADLERVGFERFRDYHIEAILNHLCYDLLELGDYDKALEALTVAERFVEPTSEGWYHYTLTYNRLEACYRQKKDLVKALDCAHKILDFNASVRLETPEGRWRTRFWQGLAALDIADMLIEQGRLAEGEQYAAQGYELSRVGDSSPTIDATIAEFDALQVLLAIKVKIRKTDEVGALIRRSEALRPKLDANPDASPFRYLKFYNNCARYYELKGALPEALRFSRLAQTMQDSFSRYSDARKYQQLQRRMDAEKYQEQIRLVEGEKQLQTGLFSAALVILLLLLLLGWINFSRIRAKRRLALIALQAANDRLEALTAGLHEKSALVEHMRLEIEKIASGDERARLLKELTQSTVLTAADWQHFRALFEQVYPGYIEEQTTRDPELSAAELRLVVFEKLGLGDQETANLLGISRSSVQQTRWRMKKRKPD